MPYLATIHKLQDPAGWNQPWPADAGVTRRLSDHEVTQHMHAAFEAALWSNVAIDLLKNRRV
jgi:hypothetical protein